MSWLGRLVKIWAWIGILLVLGVVAFLFLYIFIQGADVISWEFLSQPPRGVVLGSEGGIWPAIAGSFCFTATAVVLGGFPAVATALFVVYGCPSPRMASAIRMVIRCIAGVPSIVLGLFAYSLLVRDLNWGRCILSAGVALAIMILPFIEVRAEKAFQELPRATLQASYALGCSKAYTICRIVLPACRGELISALILGGCYAMGATAPMMFTGAVAYAAAPTGLLEPAMALPMHLYLLVSQGATSMDTAYGTAFVMMAVIFVSNLLATLYTGRSHRTWKQS